MGSRDLTNWVEHAVQEGLLQPGSPAHELAQRAIREGIDSLSPQQRGVYVTQVVPVLNEVARRHLAREVLVSWRRGSPRVIGAVQGARS
jgi:hypothetical protein